MSDSVILPSFSLPIWSSSSSAAVVETRRRAARQVHLVDDLDAAELLARAASVSLRFARRQRRELPDSVTRTTSRSADQTNGLASGTRRVSSLTSRTPGHGFDRRHRAPAAVFGKRIRAKVTSRPATAIRVLSRTVSWSAAATAGRQIGFQRLGVGPGGKSPKDGQRNQPRPPFAGST